jgi:hypothetical protein
MISLLKKTSFAVASLAVGGADAGHVIADVSIDFSAANAVATYKTTATLQVVENPLLDRTFTVNGTEIPNPIHKAAWNSLKELNADHVRFQPWFPYPHKAVAELDAPVPGKPTSWNFTSMMPQLEDFMANTAAQGHPVIWNFGTIPCWMFWGPSTNHSHCPYPKDPEALDFGYGARGFRPVFFKDKTGKMLAEYYARLFSFMINGYMIDENGVVHNGGPKYDFSASAGHIFEFLNEAEHYYSPSEYVNDYDATVTSLQSALGPTGMPKMMGIGGCHDGEWNWWFMGNCTKWINEFLDRSKHKVHNVPLDYASMHYYATTNNRSDVNGYTKNFFGSADKYLVHIDGHIAQRDRLSPTTKLALTELGILMVDDMINNYGPDGGLPDMFFNAAASFLAYVFVNIAKKGIDIACFSQFVGNPPIEKWGIKDMNFPSGSMISWETGLGNAKYWVLKLLIDHIKKGDQIIDAQVQMTELSDPPAEKVMCEAVGPWTFNNEITLTCKDPNARIDQIWADMGLEPKGLCGEYTPSPNCSNNLLATGWAAFHCFGRRSCTLTKANNLQEFGVCPEQVLVKKNVNFFSERLTVQASCTGDKGGITSSEYTGDSVFSQAFISPDGKSKKLLLVNKLGHDVEVRVHSPELAKGGVNAFIVDPVSVSRSSANGIRQEVWKSKISSSSIKVTLKPYSVAMAVMGEGAATSQTTSVLI